MKYMGWTPTALNCCPMSTFWEVIETMTEEAAAAKKQQEQSRARGRRR